MVLSQIFWTVNPEIFSLGPLSVRWYGLFWALAFYMGYEILFRIYKKEKVPLKELEKLIIFFAIGSVVGARLGHCFFYDWWYYKENLVEILYIWKGGLASHGGAIGIIIALFLFNKYVNSKKMIWALDRMVIPIALGAAFIRLGNLMNHEIYGYSTDLSWGFAFIINLRDWMEGFEPAFTSFRHPTQIYEALAYFALFAILLVLYIKRGSKLQDGLLSAIFAIVMFTSRFLIEYVKMPQEGVELGLPVNMGQILSIPLIITGIVLLYLSLKKKL